jgi:hypothetical protein
MLAAATASRHQQEAGLDLRLRIRRLERVQGHGPLEDGLRL